MKQFLPKIYHKLWRTIYGFAEVIRVYLIFVLNHILLIKLSLYKKLKGVERPIIHYYTICWNEEKMLPFVFQYYEKIVDKFFIYDNFSNDKTESIVKAHNNTHIIKFGQEGVLSDLDYLKIKNQVWKNSRGKADFVIVCDVDEFLYSENLYNFIQKIYKEKYTLIKPHGYDMYSEVYPQYDERKCICNIVKRGKRYELFDKCILFDPHRIVEINYTPGCHTCNPKGSIKIYNEPRIKLLHYKWLSLQYVINRHHLYQQRLSKENIEKGWGTHYMSEDNVFTDNFNKEFAETSNII